MVDLVVEHLNKQYGHALKAIDDVSFTVRSGEFLTLLGPSGCGKSTTLGAIAGLARADTGRILFGEETIFDGARGICKPAETRNAGLVFQSYALWPHMTVAQNLAFPLKLRRVGKAERARRIGEVLDLVEMGQYAERYPNELSGGQQQRVALARTIVYQPSILLLDEPLSNLDAKLRDRARIWLTELQKRLNLTTIYVTHDQGEALAMSDRIAVMSKGRVVQLGTPHEIYQRPTDPFVADFIGTSSFFPGRLVGVDPSGMAKVALTGGKELLVAKAGPARTGDEVTVAIRPERLGIRLDANRRPSDCDGVMLPARTLSHSYLGARYEYVVEIEGVVARTESPDQLPNGRAHVWIPADGCVLFPRKEAN